MKNLKKLTPKESVIKGLETRKKNLEKKSESVAKEYREKRMAILADLHVVNIQLQALRKK